MPTPSAAPAFKIPESVLVVVHTAALNVLLIRRADTAADYWQSVTGSKDSLDEAFAAGGTGQFQGFAQAVFVDIGQRQAPALACPAQSHLAAQTGACASNHDAVVHACLPCSVSKRLTGSVAAPAGAAVHHHPAE